MLDTDERTKQRIRAYNLVMDTDIRPQPKRKRLSWGTVMNIRMMYLQGNISQSEVARRFQVSQSLVSKICNNVLHPLSREDGLPEGAADDELLDPWDDDI
jgi:hypothetical protein